MKNIHYGDVYSDNWHDVGSITIHFQNTTRLFLLRPYPLYFIENTRKKSPENKQSETIIDNTRRQAKQGGKQKDNGKYINGKDINYLNIASQLLVLK